MAAASDRRILMTGKLGVVLLCLVAVQSAVQARRGEPRMTFTLSSPAFVQEGEIPARQTCQGEDLSPALSWTGVPEGARSLALVVDDPDAPDPAAPKMTWVHWVAYNLPATLSGLPEGVRLTDLGLPGVNDWKKTTYGGPCPPIGRHRYFFKLYALDVVLPDLHRPSKMDLEEAMRGHVLAQATLMGTYQKTGLR